MVYNRIAAYSGVCSGFSACNPSIWKNNSSNSDMVFSGQYTGEKYTVEYQVVITDESVIGKEIHNHVIVRSDNCEEKEDEEKVEVEEPEKPKEEPPKEPEEPEEPEEPKEPELPVPEEPEEITQKVEKTNPVKTGDEGNLMVLIVISILSCTVLFICGRISRNCLLYTSPSPRDA